MPRKKHTLTGFAAALARLRDEPTSLSATALSALSGAGKQELGAFAQTWTQLPVERRRRAARLTVELAEQDFKLDFNLLYRYFLTDDDAPVRAAGIEGLWEDEDPALVKPLIGFLRSDPDAGVRAAAADALGRFMLLGEYGRLPENQTALIGEALLATTRSASEALTVRCRAVEALAYWSHDLVNAVIELAYDDAAPAMRASAVAAMGRTADTSWRKTAQDELDSPDARMRFEAARATGELENRAAAPRLAELLDDPDRAVQSAAITALGQIRGRLAKEALMQAAAADDEVLSALAGEALQELEFATSSELLLFDLKPTEETDQADGDDEDIAE